MSDNATFSRRKFMQMTAIASAAAPLSGCVGGSGPWRYFTEDQGRTLAAICERIIPADQDPGAGWAGAAIFIDRQLMGPYRRLRQTYEAGLAGVDATSLATFGKRFAVLSPTQQDSVLIAMDTGQARGDCWNQVSAKSFFDLLVSHTKQGFYGDPRHGGNRDRVSWKMLRLPYPPVRGRQ